MYISTVLMGLATVALLAGSSQQKALPSAQGPPGGQGGMGMGMGRSQGGFGGQGGDSRAGFNIVDTNEKYGYDFNYPGANGYFYLLGANRGPGAQRGGREMSGPGGQGQSYYRERQKRK